MGASMRPVLKYPGSKWNIAGKLSCLIPEHHSYVEPYFGSGALLFHKPASDMETVNDLDSEVVNLFRCIQKDSERLSRLVVTTPYSREVYERQFTASPEELYASDFQKAAGFLVRCWQGYGYRTDGSKVGWKNDVQGRERAYALRDWYRLPDWIIEATDRLRRVQIENRPALEVIKRFDYGNVFIYLDPPYLIGTRSGSRKQYRHEMTDGEHEELLKVLVKLRAKVMVSGYESELYNDYLTGWTKKCFKSCAEQGSPRVETVWMNYSTARQMTIYDMAEVVG